MRPGGGSHNSGPHCKLHGAGRTARSKGRLAAALILLPAGHGSGRTTAHQHGQQLHGTMGTGCQPWRGIHGQRTAFKAASKSQKRGPQLELHEHLRQAATSSSPAPINTVKTRLKGTPAFRSLTSCVTMSMVPLHFQLPAVGG